MNGVKTSLLFLVDKPEQHSELIRDLYCLKNINVMRMDMNFNQVRGFINRKRNCVIFLIVEESKGKAMNMLHNIYNNTYNTPYIISVFRTSRERFLEHVKTCGIFKLFCVKSKDYDDKKVIEWVEKICNYISMNSVFPFSQSYANSYVRSKICQKLENIGMTCYLTGYKYIVDAIELYMKNLNFYITSDIYKELSQRYKTAAANIDRCMRHAIEVVWRDTSFGCLEKNYPDSTKIYEERPSVLEFVKCLAEDIKTNINF